MPENRFCLPYPFFRGVNTPVNALGAKKWHSRIGALHGNRCNAVAERKTSPCTWTPLLLIGLLLWGGCTTIGSYLETRNAEGCYRLEGHASAYVAIHGLVATGGATLDQCASYHNLTPPRLYQPPVPKETPATLPSGELHW